MTYTNEQIEAMASGCDQCGDPAVGEMLRAWIAERKKMVVTDGSVDTAIYEWFDDPTRIGGTTPEFRRRMRNALEAALKEMQK